MQNYEEQLKGKGYRLVIGIDEAGRGPLAGPVVAAAVAIRDYNFTVKITDSKKISHRQRELAFQEIMANAYVGIGIMSEAVIDQVNILQATFLAMNTAVGQLYYQLDEGVRSNADISNQVYLLIDGNRFRSRWPFKYETVVKGDSSVFSIACASIIAKVTRDRILAVYDQVFPQYDFKKHKGYPTLKHKEAIKEHGLSLIHRRSFSYT